MQTDGDGDRRTETEEEREKEREREEEMEGQRCRTVPERKTRREKGEDNPLFFAG